MWGDYCHNPLRIMFCIISVICMLLPLTLCGGSGEVLRFSGQASAWTHVHPNANMPLWVGVRYIPQANYGMAIHTTKRIDVEVSANLRGLTGLGIKESQMADGDMRPYRAWLRYSGDQFELRLGLQKINFGSAAMLRPLMWFDQMDPRDPLQLTDGVWGLLGKYYFLNNANVWLWGLYGNKEPKTWEVGQTTMGRPEFGGRLQVPVWRGEAALSTHYRQVDTSPFTPFIGGHDHMPETRIGLDAKWDMEAGLWLEASLISKHRKFGMLTHQHMFTAGIDYTFGIGNGLSAMIENLWFAPGHTLFYWQESLNFSAFSVSYPVSMFSNINAIVYFDWRNKQTYNFINIRQDYRKITFYLMAFWNPDTFQLPQQTGSTSMFSGRGIQVMMVWNHTRDIRNICKRQPG